MIGFEIVGKPATQGSKVEQVIRRRGGAPVMKDGRALTVIREANPRLPEWRQEVARTARQAYNGELFIGAMAVTLTFHRPRPKSHYGSGRNAGVLKASAPKYPIQRPDLLKLARAVEDSLTSVIWADDAQIVDELIRKEWGPYFCVVVEITSLDGLTREPQT